MHFWKIENYYFISIPNICKETITSTKRDQNSFIVSQEESRHRSSKGPLSFSKKKGVLISSHLPPSSGALHFSILLDSHKTFSEVFLNWNWDMFSVSQVKQ